MLDPLRVQGIARTPTLLEQGWSRHRISLALREGHLVRLRRGWVALPTADPLLVRAARSGVMLSCVSQARRLGLWVHDLTEPHFAARATGARRPQTGVLHWQTPVVARDPEAIEDDLINVLIIIAHCQPFEEAVAIWDSALNQGLVEWLTLKNLRLSGRALEVLNASNRFSDSGLESYVRVRLRWMKVRIVAQAWVEGHRVDFLIGERFILQIDGSHHVGKQRTSDVEHDARLALLGYEVMRVTYAQVMHDWPHVQQRIMQAIAQGKHLAAG